MAMLLARSLEPTSAKGMLLAAGVGDKEADELVAWSCSAESGATTSTPTTPVPAPKFTPVKVAEKVNLVGQAAQIGQVLCALLFVTREGSIVAAVLKTHFVLGGEFLCQYPPFSPLGRRGRSPEEGQGQFPQIALAFGLYSG